jgi:SAM-dependent methyltransferase
MKRAGRTVTVRDPGILLAETYQRIYAPGIARAFALEGEVRVDLVGGDGRARPGAVVEHVLERVGAVSGKSLLELGCGVGRSAVATFASKSLSFRRVEGIDPSPWNVDQAQQRAAALARPGREIVFRRGDLFRPYPEENPGAWPRHDVVLIRDVLHHVTEKKKVIEAAASALAPGGLLVVLDWVQRRTASRADWGLLLDRVWSTDLATEPEYAVMMEEAGLSVAGTESLDKRMHEFFEMRYRALEKIEKQRDAAGSPESGAGTSDAVIERRRALADIRELCGLSDSGPLGWMVMWARL